MSCCCFFFLPFILFFLQFVRKFKKSQLSSPIVSNYYNVSFHNLLFDEFFFLPPVSVCLQYCTFIQNGPIRTSQTTWICHWMSLCGHKCPCVKRGTGMHILWLHTEVVSWRSLNSLTAANVVLITSCCWGHIGCFKKL